MFIVFRTYAKEIKPPQSAFANPSLGNRKVDNGTFLLTKAASEIVKGTFNVPFWHFYLLFTMLNVLLGIFKVPFSTSNIAFSTPESFRMRHTFNKEGTSIIFCIIS